MWGVSLLLLQSTKIILIWWFFLRINLAHTFLCFCGKAYSKFNDMNIYRTINLRSTIGNNQLAILSSSNSKLVCDWILVFIRYAILSDWLILRFTLFFKTTTNNECQQWLSWWYYQWRSITCSLPSLDHMRRSHRKQRWHASYVHKEVSSNVDTFCLLCFVHQNCLLFTIVNHR